MNPLYTLCVPNGVHTNTLQANTEGVSHYLQPVLYLYQRIHTSLVLPSFILRPLSLRHLFHFLNFSFSSSSCLLEHRIKVLKEVLEKRLRQKVKIDDMQFGLVPGKGTVDAIFMVRQLQEKILRKEKGFILCICELREDI